MFFPLSHCELSAQQRVTNCCSVPKMISGGYVQLNMGSGQWWGPGILYFPKVLSFAEMKTSDCEQKNLHTERHYFVHPTFLYPQIQFVTSVAVMCTCVQRTWWWHVKSSLSSWQIRLTNGQALTQTFGSKEQLSAVRLYVEMNRTDESGPFSLMTNFPKKVFTDDDYEKPLDLLGMLLTFALNWNRTND
jgi:hypothetical protein